MASKTGFILITIAIMVLCGMFLDTSANNLILGPIFSPIAAMYGMDPVHFGLIFVFLLALGQATPPFGTCLFVSCTLNNDTFSDVVRERFPLYDHGVGLYHPVCLCARTEHLATRHDAGIKISCEVCEYEFCSKCAELE